MPGNLADPEFLTIEEVSSLLRLSDRSIYDLCRGGRLPGAAKVGGVWRVDREVLQAWLAAGGNAGHQEPPRKED